MFITIGKNNLQLFLKVPGIFLGHSSVIHYPIEHPALRALWHPIYFPVHNNHNNKTVVVQICLANANIKNILMAQ